ncbi:hypothetical protein Droror1_Dr00019878 [Drosera rotundifolia]
MEDCGGMYTKLHQLIQTPHLLCSLHLSSFSATPWQELHSPSPCAFALNYDTFVDHLPVPLWLPLRRSARPHGLVELRRGVLETIVAQLRGGGTAMNATGNGGGAAGCFLYLLVVTAETWEGGR